MAYILDGVVIIIFLLAVFLGYRRGFFKSIIQLVGCIAAALIASGLSTPLASGVYDQFISGSIEKSIEAQIKNAGAGSVDTSLDGVLDDLPDAVTNALTMFDLGTPEQIKNKLQGSLNGTVTQISTQIEQKVVRPAAVSLLRVLCFFILFIVLMILAGLAASLVGKITRIPILRQTDGLLGAVLGAVQGVILVFVAVTLMSLIAASSKSDDKITRATMNHTVLVHSVEKVNPVTNTLYSMFGADSV